jgi:endonuclease-3 related protein
VNRRFDPPRAELLAVYDRLLQCYGGQNWWPADSAFEVMVGAILTQNTAWTNVERAIQNLKDAGVLSFRKLPTVPKARLAELIRPAGYFNVKAERLLNYCSFLVQSGGDAALRELQTDALRQALLSVNGVGPETADDILLYAFERPVFVIDAYTRRIFFRLGLAQGDEDYEELRAGFESALGPQVKQYNEYHALLVRHAKEACGRKPHCAECCLVGNCARRDLPGE